MGGAKMKIKYTASFADSLNQIIRYWQDQLKLSDEKIISFVDHIQQKIDLLTRFPRMGKDITNQYQLKRTTYYLLIGHSYEIFYRIDGQNGVIIIGAIFSAHQVKVKF